MNSQTKEKDRQRARKWSGGIESRKKEPLRSTISTKFFLMRRNVTKKVFAIEDFPSLTTFSTYKQNMTKKSLICTEII